VIGINQTVMGESNVMSGGGIVLRHRTTRHLGFELGLDGAAGSFGDGRFKRSSFIPTASVLFHMIPHGPFDLFLIGGIGGVASTVRIEDPPGHPELSLGRQSFGEFQAHLGVGAELRLGHVVGIVSDLRYVARVLDTSSDDGRWYRGIEDGPIPSSSHGAQFTLGVMLHF